MNTLRPRQSGRNFADDTFKCIFFYENVSVLIKIRLNSLPKCPINNISALVQIMAWRLPGDKPLSKPMMVRLLTHICVTRPQWIKMTKMMKLVYITFLRRNALVQQKWCQTNPISSSSRGPLFDCFCWIMQRKIGTPRALLFVAGDIHLLSGERLVGMALFGSGLHIAHIKSTPPMC